ncbi:MAG: hypothetical protein LBB84_05125 [Tannerellaceae bacterium]|jgi:hypothetical protein|nr:hypothetical protein [Tannerellaceae bacterium]
MKNLDLNANGVQEMTVSEKETLGVDLLSNLLLVSIVRIAVITGLGFGNYFNC